MGTIQVVLGLAKATHEEIAKKLEDVGTAMDGNPTFPAPPVPPSVLIKQAADLRADVRAQSDAKVVLLAATARLKLSKKTSTDLLMKEGGYVAIVADGSEVKAKSAAMTLKGKATHPRTIAAPKGVTVTLGNQAHEVRVQFRAGRSTAEHRVETTTDPSKVDSWTLAGASMTSSLVISALPTGFRSFRVIAANGDRVSAPSGIVTIFVP